jgi:hypothetical protein
MPVTVMVNAAYELHSHGYRQKSLAVREGIDEALLSLGRRY